MLEWGVAGFPLEAVSECSWQGKPAVTALTMSEDEAWVAVGCRLGALLFVQAGSGAVTRHELGSTVQLLALSGDGNIVVAALEWAGGGPGEHCS